MGEAVVSVFVYMGIGSGILLAGAIGLFLLGDEIRKIRRFGT